MNQVTNPAEIKLIEFIFLPQTATFNNTVSYITNIGHSLELHVSELL